MSEYRELSPMMMSMVRNIAKLQLLEWGVEEIGTSDINCQIVNLYNDHGGFDSVVRHGLDLARA